MQCITLLSTAMLLLLSARDGDCYLWPAQPFWLKRRVVARLAHVTQLKC